MLVLAAPLLAQPGKEAREEKIEAFKIAFFTEQLQLTPEESQKFWPLFNQFENEREALRESHDLDAKKLELLSDKEVENFMNQHFEMEEKLLKLRRDYARRFQEVLPIRKVAMLQRLERKFAQTLLEELKRRKENRQENPKPRNFRRD